MSLELIAALLVLGACTGYLAGLLGIGGGMVLTPFLTLILSMAGVPDTVVVHAAIATSLSTILFTSLSSVRAHNSRGAVLWKVVLWLAPEFWWARVRRQDFEPFAHLLDFDCLCGVCGLFSTQNVS